MYPIKTNYNTHIRSWNPHESVLHNLKSWIYKYMMLYFVYIWPAEVSEEHVFGNNYGLFPFQNGIQIIHQLQTNVYKLKLHNSI